LQHLTTSPPKRQASFAARKTSSRSAITFPKAATTRKSVFSPARLFSDKANITASKSFYLQSDYRFDTKTFTELKNAQSIVIAYDGLNPMPPCFGYLKPYFNDPNKSYFKQLAQGAL
jgi:hypothetical protein